MGKSLIIKYFKDYKNENKSHINLRKRRQTSMINFIQDIYKTQILAQTQTCLQERQKNDQKLSNLFKLKNFEDDSDQSEDMYTELRPRKRRLDSDNEEMSNMEENHDYCDICMQGGEIMLCDSCPRSYHLICILPDMNNPPEGVWNCPTCVYPLPDHV
ncbi:chromodomain-helicase-DNA-binding protein Mi-2 homolog [Octopus sinensis]|uniref:Chromodomain-helicase-DNA-binding protein Mi-2 homolog n=1 Tax=Octopus sinensis TaxID=2607531 RepID=A0A7E6EGJ3_9MOLL|nr:chromodomain-helicase-DNA-binding protein Mi-2 homolog [Octopus sinensis]